jgi:hypothetical protein
VLSEGEVTDGPMKPSLYSAARCMRVHLVDHIESLFLLLLNREIVPLLPQFYHGCDCRPPKGDFLSATSTSAIPIPALLRDHHFQPPQIGRPYPRGLSARPIPRARATGKFPLQPTLPRCAHRTARSPRSRPRERQTRTDACPDIHSGSDLLANIRECQCPQLRDHRRRRKRKQVAFPISRLALSSSSFRLTPFLKKYSRRETVHPHNHAA